MEKYSEKIPTSVICVYLSIMILIGVPIFGLCMHFESMQREYKKIEEKCNYIIIVSLNDNENDDIYYFDFGKEHKVTVKETKDSLIVNYGNRTSKFSSWYYWKKTTINEINFYDMKNYYERFVDNEKNEKTG